MIKQSKAWLSIHKHSKKSYIYIYVSSGSKPFKKNGFTHKPRVMPLYYRKHRFSRNLGIFQIMCMWWICSNFMLFLMKKRVGDKPVLNPYPTHYLPGLTHYFGTETRVLMQTPGLRNPYWNPTNPLFTRTNCKPIIFFRVWESLENMDFFGIAKHVPYHRVVPS